MKTLRLFGMMLMTVLMAFNMAACGDDDEEDGNGNGGSSNYVGIWIESDTDERMDVVTLKTSSWQTDNYRSNNGEVTKRTSTGPMTVNGNQITISGAPFESGTYSISGNTMTIKAKSQNGEETMKLTRATDDQIKRIAAWETLVLASKQK